MLPNYFFRNAVVVVLFFALISSAFYWLKQPANIAEKPSELNQVQ